MFYAILIVVLSFNVSMIASPKVRKAVNKVPGF